MKISSATKTVPDDALVRRDLRCVVCKGDLSKTATSWLAECRRCGFLTSDLGGSPQWESGASTLDEAHRIAAIKQLRQENARRILERVSKLRSLRGQSLLDVGCGYGWFLEVASSFGIKAHGVEPEQLIAAAARQAGNSVSIGCFPEVFGPNTEYDLITFNDVLEHIPAPEKTVAACHQHLRQDGLLAVVIPASTGVLYRVASILHRFGVTGPFNRLWQKNFHSPHVSYFHDENLQTLVENAGFRLVLRCPLPTFEVNGLWDRLCMDQTQSRLTAPLLYAGLTAAAPLMQLLPPDIIFHVYQRLPQPVFATGMISG